MFRGLVWVSINYKKKKKELAWAEHLLVRRGRFFKGLQLKSTSLHLISICNKRGLIALVLLPRDMQFRSSWSREKRSGYRHR